MLTRESALEMLNSNVEKIKEFGVKKIGIFGSFSRETQKDTSDIDVLVEFKLGEKTFKNFMHLKLFLEELFDRNVDLVTNDGLREELGPSIIKSVIHATGL